MKVKVILRSDISGLGEEGDVKEVAGGYARNYLLPRDLVVPATAGNLKLLEQQRARIEEKLEQRRAEARSVAERLNTVVLDFPVRVGEQNRLYGSITAQDIAARLHDESGVEVDRRAIELGEPLRTLGTFTVPVRVAHAVSAHITVVLRDQAASTTVAEPEPTTASAADTAAETDDAAVEDATVAAVE